MISKENTEAAKHVKQVYPQRMGQQETKQGRVYLASQDGVSLRKQFDTSRARVEIRSSKAWAVARAAGESSQSRDVTGMETRSEWAEWFIGDEEMRGRCG